MTTEKLIEIAKICGKGGCNIIDCPYRDDGVPECLTKLLKDVTYRLGKAYIELKDQGYCSTCKYSNICSGDGDADTGCNGSDKWEWAGDSK